VLDPAERAAFAEAEYLLAVRVMLQENRSEKKFSLPDNSGG